MSKIYEQAKANYPKPWNRAMVDRLFERGRLTQEEYNDVLGIDPDEEHGEDE